VFSKALNPFYATRALDSDYILPEPKPRFHKQGIVFLHLRQWKCICLSVLD